MPSCKFDRLLKKYWKLPIKRKKNKQTTTNKTYLILVNIFDNWVCNKKYVPPPPSPKYNNRKIKSILKFILKSLNGFFCHLIALIHTTPLYDISDSKRTTSTSTFCSRMALITIIPIKEEIFQIFILLISNFPHSILHSWLWWKSSLW